MGEDGGGGHHRQVQYIHLKVQCMTDKWIEFYKVDADKAAFLFHLIYLFDLRN